MPLGASFFEDVPLVGFIYLVFTRTPDGVTAGDSGLCCSVPLSVERYYFPSFGDLAYFCPTNPTDRATCLIMGNRCVVHVCTSELFFLLPFSAQTT